MAGAAQTAKAKGPFRLCFNTATIMGKNLPITEEIDIVAKAGYDGIEPWIRKIEDYKSKGGTLADLKKRIADAGLAVEGAIGFVGWIMDDEAARAKGVEQMKRDMDLVAQIGGTRIAAPPVGATDKPGLDLDAAAARYRVILDAGANIGVIPQLELWGHSKNLHRLGQCMHALAQPVHACDRGIRASEGGITGRFLPYLQGRVGLCGTDGDWPLGAADLPHERLPRHAAARDDQRPGPRDAGRRDCAAAAIDPGDARPGLQAGVFAGAIQPKVLGPGPGGGGQGRHREDAGGDRQGNGIRIFNFRFSIWIRRY
jgi:hypothetical protein